MRSVLDPSNRDDDEVMRLGDVGRCGEEKGVLWGVVGAEKIQIFQIFEKSL